MHTTAVPSSSINRLSTATPNKDPPKEWGWSSWNQWNGCSKTCDGGQQVRYRTCNVIQDRVSSDLDTTNGSCVGKSQQVRGCADWNCPDCNKTCKVGTLNAACDACECAHHVLTGRILTAEGRALSKANISLAETPYNVISQSNVSGHFRVFGVCASSQLFLVVRESFVPLRVLSKKQSATESKLDAKLENAVSPSVRVHPESKMRISGQSVVFCCNVEGNPTPEVEWFRNGNILSSDKYNYTNTIYIPNVSEMGGVYKCRAVNDFGAEYSKEAELTVVDSVKDSCSSTPTVHNMTLPPGCFHEETNSSVVNIGYCADSRCVRNDTNFTGDACSDRNYCCGSQKTSNVPVLCSGNVSFKLPTIQECGCTECRVKMAFIQGIVVGGAEEFPMEYGDVIVEGHDNTFTNAEGRFLVAVPKEVRRVVMTFTDIFQKLESTTKVFRVDTKQSNFYKIHLRERAPVMEFSGTNLKDFPLSRGNEPSFADLEIAEDSFLSEDGTPYHGQVKARVGFTDPRNLSDILMAPGDFSTLNENGEEQILTSYGMFKLNFEDSKGKRLDLAKPIKVFLDPEQINMTTSNGNTTAKLWWLNKKTGRWVPAGELYPTDQNSGKRRKRSNRRFFLAELSEAVPQDTEYNIDRPDVYNVVAVEAPVDALVTMVGKQAESNQFYGYRQEAVSNQNTRRVYIPTYTNGEAFLLAEKDGEPLEPLQPNASFPSAVQATVLTNNSIGNNIAVKAFSYKSVVTGCSGPIYELWSRRYCANHLSRVKYAFKFRETNVPQPTFEMSTTRINDRINPHLWYGRPPYNEKAERCYIKVKVIGSRSVIMVKSSTKYLQGPNIVNVDYGYSAAITEATGTFAGNKNVSVVCLEYRCNGLLIDNSQGTQYQNSKQQTLLAVVPLTSNCVFKELDNALEVKQSSCEFLPTNSTGQGKSFCVPQGVVGGGVGLYSGTDDVVQSRCYEGNNALTAPTKEKKAHGHTLTFNCS